MPTDLNPEGERQFPPPILLKWLSHQTVKSGDLVQELDYWARKMAGDSAGPHYAAYQSTIHESSETRLGEIEARLAKATPGPWVERDDEIWGHTATIVSHRRVCTPRDANRVANADLIAHAPSDIRALLDIIRSGGEDA